LKCQEVLRYLSEARTSLRMAHRQLTVGNIVVKKKLKAAGRVIEQLIFRSRVAMEDSKNWRFGVTVDLRKLSQKSIGVLLWCRAQSSRQCSA
jgi:hypothetical protein